MMRLAILLSAWLSTNAWAMAPNPNSGGGESGGLLASLPFLLLMFGVMYFLVIRPQKKQADQHKQFLSTLQKGDDVVTSGGVCGKIVGVADNLVTLEIANNVKIKILKGHIHKLPAAMATTTAEGATPMVVQK